jgi:hypothetical protein
VARGMGFGVLRDALQGLDGETRLSVFVRGSLLLLASS